MRIKNRLTDKKEEWDTGEGGEEKQQQTKKSSLEQIFRGLNSKCLGVCVYKMFFY